MTKIVNPKFSIGQIVYLITDGNQLDRMVVQITISSDGISYNLACGSESSWHYEIEISIDKDELKVL